MQDFYEIDFLDVETKKSGDAITVRHSLNGQEYIHVVDGGYVSNGRMVVDHIKKYYGGSSRVDHVVSTHPDSDHTGGLRLVLEEMEVGTLWMNRPWLYSEEIIHRFSRFKNADNLSKALKEAYPNTAALEEISLKKGIRIEEAFQGKSVGAFTIMAPTRSRYLDKVVDSEKTGQVAKLVNEGDVTATALRKLSDFISKMVSYVKSAWGDENFPEEPTSAENEMSVVQYAVLCGEKVLLTADTGREGLQEVIDYAPWVGLSLPGIDRFQVPHHGSRRNVSTDLLDKILGRRLDYPSESHFSAIISSAKEDEDHPRKAVVRAMHHRGAKVDTTEGNSIRVGRNTPVRAGWVSTPGVPYPDDQEN